jgi:hypothetical protein
MRDLTSAELELETADRLPARELMGRPPWGGHVTNGSFNGNTAQFGAANFAVGNGNGNGSLFVVFGGGPVIYE